MSIKLDKGIIALRCQDIQTGLQDCNVSSFRTVFEIGWALRIAICLRSVGSIEYQRLRNISGYLFGVNQWGFDSVVNILQEVNYIRIIGNEPNRQVVPQNIPYFNDLYPSLGEVAEAHGLNEHEQLSIAILDALSKRPLSRDLVYQSVGADKQTFQEVLEIGNAGSYVDVVQTAQGKILTSPMYFSENHVEFAEIVAQYGDRDVKRVMDVLRECPGCPLVLIKAGRVGDNKLNRNELGVAGSIVKRALAQPPAIRSRGIDHHFIFTPRIGAEKIEVIEKHLYERAISIGSVIRFDRHFADWEIQSPVEFLEALRDRGHLRPPGTVRDQYVKLAIQGIVRFDPPPPEPFKDVVFIDNIENQKAISLALEMFREQGAEPGRPSDLKAVHALSSDTCYLEFIRGQRHIRSLKNIGGFDRIADAKVNDVIGTLSNQLVKSFGCGER